MVSALDVIVWAVDPEENTLQATADYLGGYAEEFLAASGLDYRFKIPVELPAVIMDGHTRHGLFLAVKEALNNVVRHARAGTVEFSLSARDGLFRIEITDNGVGFDPASDSGGYGVGNLQKRLESLGGNCRIHSRPGAGTRIEMTLPITS
jgi:signal transduction histidine kinase